MGNSAFNNPFLKFKKAVTTPPAVPILNSPVMTIVYQRNQCFGSFLVSQRYLVQFQCTNQHNHTQEELHQNSTSTSCYSNRNIIFVCFLNGQLLCDNERSDIHSPIQNGSQIPISNGACHKSETTHPEKGLYQLFFGVFKEKRQEEIRACCDFV
jgi:hypothetical protein